MLENLGKWLNDPKMKRSTFLFVIIGILFYIFQETTFFDDLSQNWKTLIYIAIIVIAALLGVSIGSLKEFNSELNEIIKDAKLTETEKINALTALAVKVNAQLGNAWESYNMTQDADSETHDNVDEINVIKAKLEELQKELEGNYNTTDTSELNTNQ